MVYPKFGLTADERQDLLDDYLTYCETVTIADSPPVVPEYRDPFDRPFLEMALVGRADTLIPASWRSRNRLRSHTASCRTRDAAARYGECRRLMLRTRYEKECRITLR